ncbi:copper resistance CopC family protein [Mycobacterium conspicuum]|jgi:methionine-rich copper-binding protein CopC|uniref:Copper resistance protein C n=1 Tax=Mycobacterium conspicuum TaxID=44010 RepID=A0A1X1T062_9MYCO|nr:copper resistance CopC family protein [Mycobacterium conspicuum]ORV37631.1 copper resistance protein CopC [Mycobacterium conspicuum]BBZ42176.1 copper resistance protein C [Mycobacterium conspicuum]
MTRRRYVTRLGPLLAVLALAATWTAPLASAHAARVSCQPADNAVLAAGPAQVSATFNEQLQTSFAAMAVVGPDGNLWSVGEPTVQGAVVSVGLRPLGPTGSYTVNYRVTSADGHVVSGSWSFRLTVAGTGTPGPAPAATGAGGAIPTWPFVAVAVVLVAGAALGAGLWAKRRRPGPTR